MYDLPKSPLKAFFMKIPYCTGKGLSNPRYCTAASISASVAFSLTIRYTGFPMTLVNINTSKDTTNNTKISWDSLVTIYRSIVAPPL